MTGPLFKGVITALITPLRDGSLDEDALDRLVDRQLAAGVDGLVPAGTTGEGATLSDAEHRRVVERVVDRVGGRARVIAGCGSPATARTIELVRHAKTVGCDGALVVTPYYNRPGQAGLVAHFEAVAEAVQLPVLLYNVPGRTGIDMADETVARLAAHPNIVGIKDATGDLGRVAWQRAHVNGPFALISGDDPSWPGYVAQGGHGVISVTSNVAPEAMCALRDAMNAGDWAGARAWQDRLIDLHRAMFVEPSPAPAKYALSRLGLCGDAVRLPLVAASETGRATVDAAMDVAGLGPEVG